jgi:thiamine biosynthesis lipoprotein
MGVPFRMVIYAPSEVSAQSAAEAAYDRIKQLNRILSDYESDSELSRLSQTAGTGKQVKVGPELWQVLERSQQIAAQSDGAFDITAGPYISLWRRARRIYRLPEPEKMAAAKEAVGFAKLRLNARNRTAELLVPKMRLDLGGIAKGYAVDQALATLKQHGVRSALVAGSGDMAVSEPPPGKPGWQIEIAAHDGTNAPAKKYAMLRNYALATSGDVFQSVLIEGKRYSHIVDPRTGIGLTDHSLVTTIAPNCMTADALATAVSVLEPQQGIAVIERIPGAAALITRQPDGAVEQRKSSRFQSFLTSGQ